VVYAMEEDLRVAPETIVEVRSLSKALFRSYLT
jgi:hypothetical protein